MGFSVTGRVLNGLEGEGVPDASVSINNQIKGKCSQTAVSWRHHPCTVAGLMAPFSPPPVTTKEDGSFRLENMTAGTYTIRVNKELMFFEPITVKIAPSTPQLPDIITAGCDWPGLVAPPLF